MMPKQLHSRLLHLKQLFRENIFLSVSEDLSERNA